MSTRAASEIASKLTIGIHEPIFAQIDPIRLGEMQAALTIALDYGTRLNERSLNLKPNALHMLASGYPSHGFVIDRKEARALFVNVRLPNEIETTIGSWAAQVFAQESRQQNGIVIDCTTVFSGSVSTAPEQPTEIQNASPTEQNEADTASDTAPEGVIEPSDGGN